MDAKTQVLQWSSPKVRLRSIAQVQARLANRESKIFAGLLAIIALVYIDQLTKVGAMCFTPPAQAMAGARHCMGLAWHIHPANAMAPLVAVAAVMVVGFLCVLPVPQAVKVLWMAAAISNNGEMLLRPGTIDFLAVRIDNCVWVANIADFYVLAGIIVLLVWIINRVRRAKSLSEPI